MTRAMFVVRTERERLDSRDCRIPWSLEKGIQ